MVTLSRQQFSLLVVVLILAPNVASAARSSSLLPDFSDVLVVLGIAFLSFVVFREVVCWYWKINEAVELLREIRDSLQRNNAGNRLAASAFDGPTPRAADRTRAPEEPLP